WKILYLVGVCVKPIGMESSWRAILEYFEPAYQIGMTATPRRDDNADTYSYFGDPLYVYSLAQGIADGFLAPYRVHRIITDTDAAGWRPTRGELDRYGREIPDDEYLTKDFERVVALRARTEAIARHLTDFLKATDRFAKTIVFCVDQEHASEMRRALISLNADLVQDYPDYVCRVTADEGEVGSAHRAKFQDVDETSPVILTTSQLLTTGVDAPTCKNIVLARVVGSMSEFKQIIGRGTRLRPEYGKLYFHIIDYTGTATEKFADPDFDGDPATTGGATIDESGATIAETPEEEAPVPPEELGSGNDGGAVLLGHGDDEDGMPRKFYVDGGTVEVIRHLVYDLDDSGRKLSCRQLTDYTGDGVRTLYPHAADFRRDWLDPGRRCEIVESLAEHGIDIETIGVTLDKPEADPFDLLCHLAYGAPLRTRRERADRVRHDEATFFSTFAPEACAVLEALLEKYAEHGEAQFKLPDALEVAPIDRFGNVIEIAGRFGGPAKLKEAVAELGRLLYAA
ncbi:MAG: type I restriction-modification enzyme R subunit C-terminal domain-containing protein, partial [Rhodospirillaceae bacterium]